MSQVAKTMTRTLYIYIYIYSGKTIKEIFLAKKFMDQAGMAFLEYDYFCKNMQNHFGRFRITIPRLAKPVKQRFTSKSQTTIFCDANEECS